MCWMLQGEFTKAIELFTKCVELFPDRVVPYTNRALCYLRVNEVWQLFVPLVGVILRNQITLLELLYVLTYCTLLALLLINFSSMCRDFPLNLVKDHIATWLLQSGMNYLLISDFHPLSTPSHAVWILNFSNSFSAPLPCCPPSDCQHLWFSIITELARVLNVCMYV